MSVRSLLRGLPIVGALVVFGPIAVASDFSGDIDVSENWFEKTDTAIGELTKLIKSMPDSDSKATRMVQLAELYWMKSSKLHLVAMSKYNVLYDEWVAADGATKGLPEPRVALLPEERKSDEQLQKAILIYEHVIAKFPENARAHVAHYYLGQSYLSIGKAERAEAVFRRLLEKYPESEYLPDAYLALGDFYFDNKKAREMYEKAGPMGKRRLEWMPKRFPDEWEWPEVQREPRTTTTSL